MPWRPQSSETLCCFGHGHENCLGGGGSGLGNVNPQKAILISGLGLAEIVAGRNFENTFKGAVINLHDEKFAFGSATTIGALATNHKPIALDGQLQVLAT